MGDKPISFRDADGNFVSAADVWNEKKLEELFNRLNPKRALRLAREKKDNEKADKEEKQPIDIDKTEPRDWIHHGGFFSH